MSMPRVAIIYLSYHSEDYLQDAVESIKNIDYPKDRLAVVFVDNPHPSFGLSVGRIEKIVEENSNSLPSTIILPQKDNLGYCGGNNVGINWALKTGFDYIFLHNQDGNLAQDCIKKMVEAMEADRSIGCAQALVMLGNTTKINTAGNSFNYLGFGFISDFGLDEKDLKINSVTEVGYASGAALMMRADLIKEYGKFDEDLFAYHEDVEYSLRLRYAGYRPVVIPDAKFFHKYEFNRSSSKFYFMERNRFAVLLMYYKWATLILLLPMLLVMELGIIWFFYSKGWFDKKIEAYRYWFDKKNIKIWLDKRSNIQKNRTINDRKLLNLSVSGINFGDKEYVKSYLLFLANPVMYIYKALIKLIIFW